MSLGHDLQTTVAGVAGGEGVGLHTGRVVRFELKPALADEGVIFVRTDLSGAPRVSVAPERVNREALARRTELIGADGTVVAMTEHLLAACLGLGLDNVTVEMNGPELPIFDGSAQPYVDAIQKAGLAELDAPRRYFRLARPVTLVKGACEIVALPAERMELAFFAELRHAGLENQACSLQVGDKAFAKTISPSRTFCFYEDVEKLRAAGLIRGGSLECAIVIKDGEPYETQYRMANELACHKLVDLMGDLAVLGRRVRALITARATGHAVHHEFIEMLRKELTEDV